MVNLMYKLYYKRRNRRAKQSLRADLARRLPGGGVGVEVGVYRGNHAKLLFEEAKPRVMYLVDPWKTGRHEGSLWGRTAQQEALEAYCSQMAYWAYHASVQNGCKVRLVRQSSLQAATRIPGPLDWVYLDGDHRFQSVMDDLVAWWPMIREGGVIYGDDWSAGQWYGTQVQDAVKAFFGRRESYNIEIHGKPRYEQWWVRKGE